MSKAMATNFASRHVVPPQEPWPAVLMARFVVKHNAVVRSHAPTFNGETERLPYKAAVTQLNAKPCAMTFRAFAVLQKTAPDTAQTAVRAIFTVTMPKDVLPKPDNVLNSPVPMSRLPMT